MCIHVKLKGASIQPITHEYGYGEREIRDVGTILVQRGYFVTLIHFFFFFLHELFS